MALPTGDLLRIQIGGAVPGDTWSCSFWFVMNGLSGTPTPTQMNTAASNFLNGWNTSVWVVAGSQWAAHCSTGTTLATGKSYLYRGGLLVSNGSAARTPSAGNGSTALPNYVARCITTLTAQPGRSRRGRFYLPATAEPITASSGLTTSIATHLGNMAGMLGTTSGAQGTGYFFSGSETADYSVVSATHGYATHITTLRADNKPDTQHGRENKLIATVLDTQAVS